MDVEHRLVNIDIFWQSAQAILTNAENSNKKASVITSDINNLSDEMDRTDVALSAAEAQVNRDHDDVTEVRNVPLEIFRTSVVFHEAKCCVWLSSSGITLIC